MEHASNQDKSAFATEPVGRLIVKFAIPCVISLVVNALYNIVDQILLAGGVGYLGNGATNIVFPITIIDLALAVLIGDGGAAYLSLKLGEGDLDSVKKGVGNTAVMITIAGIAMLVITIVFMNPVRCNRCPASGRTGVRLCHRHWPALHHDLNRAQRHDSCVRQSEIRHGIHAARRHHQHRL